MVRALRTRGALRPLSAGPLALAALVLTLAATVPTNLHGADFEWESGPGIDALVRGDVHQLSHDFPLMGPASVLLRAPFDWLVFDADIRVVYLVTTLPCVAIFVAAVLWLVRLMEAARRPPVVVAVIAGLVLVNPAVVRAIHWGHPEDLMSAGLLLAAALAAPRKRWELTALLLGLALATKPWAGLALLPVAFAAPARRLALVAVAVALAVVMTLPFVIEAPGRFRDLAGATANPEKFWHRAEVTGNVTHVTPANVFWPFAERRHEQRSGLTVESAVIPNWLVGVSHILVGLIVLPLTWLGVRMTRAGPDRWLGILALIFLFRCILDPVDFDYYHVSGLLFLGAWEGLTRRSAPLLTAWAVIGMGATFDASAMSFAALYLHAPRMNVTYLIWMLPLLGVLLRAQLGSSESRSYAGSVRNSGSASASAVASNSS